MTNNCPLCDRIMIKGLSLDKHHLIPKSYKGKITIKLHRICHRKIHSILSEKELFHHYNTIERLLEHEEIQKFVKWVSKKDPEFYAKNKDTKKRRSKRRK